MIDQKHPVVRWLVERGFLVQLHAYLRKGTVKTTITAKNPDSGKFLQGWSRTGKVDDALADLAKRAGVRVRRK